MPMRPLILLSVLLALAACNTKTDSGGPSDKADQNGPVRASGYSVTIAATVLRQGNYEYAAVLADSLVAASGLSVHNQKFAQGIRAAAALHTAHYDRAGQALDFIARGEQARDASSVDAAIAAHPNRPEGYFARAALSLAGRQYASATADCDIAIGLEMAAIWVAAWDESAWESFDAGRFQQAIDDLGDSSIKVAAHPYALLLLHLARAKLGRDDTQELARAVDAIGETDWPAPVLALYLGRIDQKQLFAAANTAPDRKKRKGQLCEANFYAGEAAALQNRLGDAHDLLDAAVDQCPPTFFEARAAGAERTRLNR